MRSIFDRSEYGPQLHSYSETLAQIVCLVYAPGNRGSTTWMDAFFAKYRDGRGEIELLNLLIDWAQEYEQLMYGHDWSDDDWYEHLSKFVHAKIF